MSEAVRGLFVGLATLDCVYLVDAPPGSNEKITAREQTLAAGGPAANAAIAFAAMGGTAVLLTPLGAHPLAALVAADLTGAGVHVRSVDAAAVDVPAVSSIYLTGATGDRSVVSVNGAARLVAAPDWVPEVVASADVLLLDGHHPRLALTAARAAVERRVPVVLDAGSWKPVFDELLPLADVVICSADLRVPGLIDGTAPDEPAADEPAPGEPAADEPAPDEPAVPDDHALTAGALLDRGARRVAISRGAAPILWWTARDSGEVAVPQVVARDTVGAGDVLHGVFALAWASGAPFQAALAAGAEAASRKCAVLGPSAWRSALSHRPAPGTNAVAEV